jgi:4-hydroxybenzoyl-CoA reductase subunit beta
MHVYPRLKENSMRLPPFDVLEPRTVKDALSMMRDHKGALKVIGGGTELVGLMKSRLVTPQYVLSTRKIGALIGIEEKKREVMIGAGTTLREIMESPLLAERFKAVAQGASAVAAYPIQTMATIGGNLLQSTRCLYYNQSEVHRHGLPACFKAGGNICNAVKGARHCFSVYQGDMAPALISLDARVQLKNEGGSRKIPLAELYTGGGKAPVSIEPDELLTHISIPIPQGSYSSTYQKLRLRKALDYPIASAAAFISATPDKEVDKVRLVLGAAGSGPRTVEDAAAFFKKKGHGDDVIEAISAKASKGAEMVDNLSFPASYRRKIIKVAAARALRETLQDLKRSGQL